MDKKIRKILSPRQDNKSKGEREKTRSQSSGTVNVIANGHRKDTDQQFEVTNFGYGDPNVLNQAPSRTQSMVKEPSQPSPSRSARPSSFGHQHTSGIHDDTEAQSALYVTPADTLARKNSSGNPPRHSVQGGNTDSSNPANLGGGGGGGGGDSMLRSEWKALQLHEKTMSQKKMLVGGGTQSACSGDQRTHSFGPGNDNSEYSVPFNLLSHQQRMPVRAPRIVSQGISDSNSERIIPINPSLSTSPQPPSDRSDTISPNSPISNNSSEPEMIQDEGNSDYAVPWENSRLLKNLRAYTKKPPLQQGKGGDTTGHSVSTHEEDQVPEKPPQRHRVTPPPPMRSGHQLQPGVEPVMAMNYGNESSPPPPDLPYDPTRPRNRGMSERIHHGGGGDGNTSPVNISGRAHSYSKSHTSGETDDPRHRSQPPAHHMPGRRLPPPPRPSDSNFHPPASDICPPPPPREHSTREDVMWRPVTIDLSIPLDDQPWYHGNVTRAEAEDILRDHHDFSFLVRKSESCQTDYSLSIRDTTPGSGGYYHLRIVYENPGYILGQFSSLFDRVTECIAYYTRQRLNIRGAEHKKLRYPVPRNHPMDRSHSFVKTVGV